jgi:hypothetical protein
MFCVILTINSDYIPEEIELASLCNGDCVY